jgi:nucleoside-diphosphate-sugar epimerase
LPAIVDAECERLLVAWAAEAEGRTETRLRIAPVVGAGVDSLFARVATGRFPFRVQGTAAPVQVVHVDDAAAALELATTSDLDGAYNVAADGWIAAADARALAGAPSRPPLPAEVAARALASTWNLGLGDAPASLLPYLRYPTVVANERLKQAGWKATHPNDETILLAPLTGETSVVPWLVGAGALATGIALGTWWLRRRGRAPR